MRKCSKCKVEKDDKEFYSNRRAEGGLDFYCKVCRNHQVRNSVITNDYVTDNRELLESLKSSCVKCGEERSYLIQFHHVNPCDKLFDVSRCGTRSQVAIIKEASKCICLCANCHIEYHYLYGKIPDNPIESLSQYLKYVI